MAKSDLIDTDFRPASYFWPMTLGTHLLASIKGAERRAKLKALIDSGRLDDIPDLLLKSALTKEERQAIGRIHPRLMGGEYLPDMKAEEVEIARITIESTTRDVTSVFARRQAGRIGYRVVDEYEGETLSGPATRTSNVPLTLTGLVEFFDAAWPLMEVLEMNFEDDLEGMMGFFYAESAFYPQIDAFYRRRVKSAFRR